MRVQPRPATQLRSLWYSYIHAHPLTKDAFHIQQYVKIQSWPQTPYFLRPILNTTVYTTAVVLISTGMIVRTATTAVAAVVVLVMLPVGATII